MTKELAPIEQVKNILSSPQMMDKFKDALPSHVTPERFLRVTMMALNKTPKLLECNRNTLYTACLLAAQDGLIPDGREAALVPFGSSVQYMPMVSGILKKVRNSGELQSLSANVVYENDEFNYWVDEQGEHFKHTPNILGKDRGVAVAVYAQALTKSGGVYLDVLTKADVEKVRGIAKSKNIWDKWPDEMWKKTAIRRLSKKLPMSTDLEVVIQRDDEMYDLDEKPSETTQEEPKSKTQPNNLMNAINAKKEPVQDAEVVAQPTTEPIPESGIPI